MQPKSDAQLLREYADHGAEGAFAEIVARHTNLVYSAALRQVESPDIAAEVAQRVFVSLARSARTLSRKINENASLAGWLCRSARNLSLNHRRDEFRRRSRERKAMETLDPNPGTSPDWDEVRPLLDEAMSELSEPDYDALVLRYFKNQDLRSVGAALGVSDDAAQKRVSRAVERLREVFTKRGMTIGVSGLAAVISANAIHAAPVGLALTISTATAAAVGTTVTAATTVTATTATATKAIAMTTLQKTVIGVTLTAAISAGIYEASQNSKLRDQVQTLQQQQVPLTERFERLQQERDNAMARVAALELENERLNRNTPELLRLRNELSQLRTDARSSQEVGTDPIETAAKSWLKKVETLKKWIEQRPEQQIPEFRYLRDHDWLDAVKDSNMLGENAPANAAPGLRESAKRQFAHELSVALRRYVEEHNGYLPSELTQLNAYFWTQPMTDDILKSYTLLHTGKLADLPEREWLVAETAPPSDQGDVWQMMIRTDDFLRVRRQE